MFSLADKKTTNTYTYNIQTGSDDLLAKIYLENKIIITRKSPDTDLEIFANLGSNFIENNDDEALSITIGNNKSYLNLMVYFKKLKENY